MNKYAKATILGAAAMLSACICFPDKKPNQPPQAQVDPNLTAHLPPTAPRNGGIVYARENRIPVSVTYQNTPYIQAGAVLLEAGQQHMITRGYVAKDHQEAPQTGWRTVFDPTAPGGRVQVPDNGRRNKVDVSRIERTEPRVQREAPIDIRPERIAAAPVVQDEPFRKPRMEPPPRRGFDANGNPIYCQGDQDPKSDNCQWPK